MNDERERRLRAAADARLRKGLEQEAEAQEEPPRRRVPFRNFESWIDRQIRQAQERGDFDNLRGHGKPLPAADPNEVHAGDDAMGLKLLKNHEALPAWIELNKEIVALREQCRRILHYYTVERDRDRRARFARDYRRRVDDLNRKIETYNLIIPAQHLEKVKLLPERDLREADQRRWAMLDEQERQAR